MILPQIGDIFAGRYRVDSALGAGGFAVVYQALDLQTNIAVAVKVLRPDGADYSAVRVGRFEREVQALRRLRNPQTVTLLDSGRTPEGVLFLVFELVEGEDLSVLIARGVLAPEAVRHIMLQVLSSLQEAHTAGILHRDIKPANIRIFSTESDPYVVKLLDFGVARPLAKEAAALTKTGHMVGTPRFAAPEQLFGGDLTPTTDLYALGLVAFEMLTGRPSEHMRLLGAHQPILLPEGVADGQMTAVIQRMLLEEPSDRYPSAAAAVHDLTHGTSQRPQRRSKPRPLGRVDARWKRWAVPLVAVLAGAVLAYFLWPEPQPDAPPSSIDTSRLRGLIDNPPTAPSVEPQPVVDSGFVLPEGMEMPRGCGVEPPFVGLRRLNAGRSWPVFIPDDYDPLKRHAVLLLFHEVGEIATDFLRYSGFVEFADQNNMVIIAPSGNYVAPWDGSLAKHLASVDVTRDQLCLDEDRIYVVGNGAGGEAAERLPCEMRVRAIVNTGDREISPHRKECEPARVPIMFFTHAKDRYNPLAGGENCIGTGRISWAQRQKYYRDFNGCRGKGREYLEYKRSVCTTWSCDEPVVACLIDAGRRWPGTHARLWDVHGCDGPPPDFDYVKTIAGFFRENTPDADLGPQPITAPTP